jgi:hypothetical protein
MNAVLSLAFIGVIGLMALISGVIGLMTLISVWGIVD